MANDENFGPIWGVPLIDVLPLNPDNPEGMHQQMPSRDDLKGILDNGQGNRVCAGYEVLLHNWRARGEEIERLKAGMDAMTKQKSEFFAEIERLRADLTEVKFLHANQMQNAFDLTQQCEAMRTDIGVFQAEIERLKAEVMFYRIKERQDRGLLSDRCIDSAVDI